MIQETEFGIMFFIFTNAILKMGTITSHESSSFVHDVYGDVNRDWGDSVTK
jgi:hypothetical protein